MLEEKLIEESWKEYKSNIKVVLSLNEEHKRLVTDLEKYPHAFVIACIMDRQIPVERAWAIPYKIKEILGDFDLNTLLNVSLEDYIKMFEKNGFHRFNEQLAICLYKAILKIKNDYDGDASNIWKGNPSSAEVVYRFLEFKGVGIKIATMAANILSRNFKVPFSDYSAIDISPDVHVKRVMKRMGLVDDDDVNKVIYKAKSIYPKFPGLLDLTCYKLGQTICRPTNPACDKCKFNDVCPKNIGE